jgi:hypothetical protein
MIFGRTLLTVRGNLRSSLDTMIRLTCPAAAATSKLVEGRLFFSTSLNENNFSDIHESHEQPPQEWTTFHGKIPILQNDPSAITASGILSEAPSHHSAMQPSPSMLGENLYGERPRVSLLMELKDRVGILHDVLKYFWKYDLNVSRIESRPVHKNSTPWSDKSSSGAVFDFYLDFDGTLNDPAAQKLMRDLAPLTEKLLVLDEKDVHWFPRHISELDLVANRTLDAGVDLESDHPGFHDETYRARRAELATYAQNHRWDAPIPRIEYTKEETETWGAVWDKMEPLWKNHACKEYLVSLVAVVVE